MYFCLICFNIFSQREACIGQGMYGQVWKFKNKNKAIAVKYFNDNEEEEAKVNNHV